MPETSSPGISDDFGPADNEQAARALLDAFARYDPDAYESLIAEDAVERRPQTGDRFVGRAKITGMYRHYPTDPPVVTWERIRGSGTVFVAEGTIDYDGSGSVERLVAVVEIRDGRMIDSNVYFASVLDPIPYHGPWPNPDGRPADDETRDQAPAAPLPIEAERLRLGRERLAADKGADGGQQAVNRLRIGPI